MKLPNVNLDINATTLLAAAVAVPALLALFSFREEIKETVALVNPLDNRNLANQAASGILARTTDDRFLSLGDLLFYALNQDAPYEQLPGVDDRPELGVN